MEAYNSIFIGSVMLAEEGSYPSKLQVMVEADSLGMVTIKFGNSMSLRLDVESADKFLGLVQAGCANAEQIMINAKNAASTLYQKEA
jgi:hypothetical protein